MFFASRLIAVLPLAAAILFPGCTTKYNSSVGVGVIEIAQPANPSGQIEPSTGSTGYVPVGGGPVGALVGGLVRGFEGERSKHDQEETQDAIDPNSPFLADQKVELGTNLAAAAAAGLKAQGYTVVSGQGAGTPTADAVLSFEFLQLNYLRTLGSAWHPQLQVKATLVNTKDKSVLFKREYFYSDLVHSIWDEALEADPKYDAESPELFGNRGKLLIEAYEAGVTMIADRVAADLAKR